MTKATQNPQWDKWSYRIGCPVWGCRTWANQVYPSGTKSEEYLTWYSRAFPTVEGNSTFYAVPQESIFQKWADACIPTFQFCFKFPRRISHDLKLVNCDQELKQWLQRLEILRKDDRLGPTFLQLAPSFSFAHFEQLACFLAKLPGDWPWAVELRHRDWFDEGEKEKRINDLLCRLQIDRVIFDSRPLNSEEATDESERTSQTRKPKSPIRMTVTGKRPMVRLIGRNNAAEVTEYWEWWADQIVQWIKHGFEPWIFTHAPDDTFAPGLARLLHEFVRIQLPSLDQLPLLSNTSCDSKGPNEDLPKQLDLF